MISFDALAGNNALKNSLKHALNERFPQTVLLSGDDPAALKTLATVLAAGILCEGAGSHPCGNCLPCRKVEQGVHPDLMIVDEGEAELKVDLARQLKAENAIIPNDGERRVTVIHHAQNLNPRAALNLRSSRRRRRCRTRKRQACLHPISLRLPNGARTA